MSAEHLEHLLHRARTFAGFRSALLRDPDGTVADYDLSAGERVALLTHDAALLCEAGLPDDLVEWWCGRPVVPAARRANGVPTRPLRDAVS